MRKNIINSVTTLEDDGSKIPNENGLINYFTTTRRIAYLAGEVSLN